MALVIGKEGMSLKAPPAGEGASPNGEAVQVDSGRASSYSKTERTDSVDYRFSPACNPLLAGRGGMISRIVGPLGLAPMIPHIVPAQSDSSGVMGVGGLIALGLTGLGLYLWHRIHRNRIMMTELPPVHDMFSEGIDETQWDRYLRKLVYKSNSRNLVVRKGGLFTRDGMELNLLHREVRDNLLRISSSDEKKIVYAVWSRRYRPPREATDLVNTFSFLSKVGESIEPSFLMREAIPLMASLPKKASQEFVDLITSMNHYEQVIKELADIYEPVLLARYFLHTGDRLSADTMAKLCAGNNGNLKSEDIAHLLVSPDHIASSPKEEDWEDNFVSAIIHMYFARTISEKGSSQYALGLASWHVKIADSILGSNYSRLIDRPSTLADLPSLDQYTGSKLLNLAQKTLLFLRNHKYLRG